jgi:hypothetical protein
VTASAGDFAGAALALVADRGGRAKLQLGRDGASCRAAYTNRFTNASALSQTSRQPLSIVNE